LHGVASVGVRVGPVKLCEILGIVGSGSDTLAETLERVIEAEGRLLRVERVPLSGPAGARASSALRLTFDVGIVTLRASGSEAEFEVEIGRLPDAGSPIFISAGEEDPWWKVMGCAPTRVQVGAEGGIRVQFRGDQDSPRRLALHPRDGGIRASAED
jgi:hypothetical protein